VDWFHLAQDKVQRGTISEVLGHTECGVSPSACCEVVRSMELTETALTVASANATTVSFECGFHNRG
jgi:hypothetical protein